MHDHRVALLAILLNHPPFTFSSLSPSLTHRIDPAHAHRQCGEATADNDRISNIDPLQNVPVRYIRYCQGARMPRFIPGPVEAQPTG